MVYTKDDLPIKKRVTFLMSDNRDDEENTLRLKTSVEPAQKTKSKTSKKKSGDQKLLKSCDPSNSKPKGKSKPKKCLVRNSEVPLSVSGGPTTSVLKGILKNPLVLLDDKTETKKESSPSSANYDSKYSIPELYTSLTIAKKISATKREKMKPPSEASSATKQLMDEKAAGRLNFPFEEQVYRDLVALNVTDEDLLKEAEKHTAKEFESTRKDQEPQLDDFYQPEQGKEYGSVSTPLPCDVGKVRRYNGHSVYNRTQLWESSALEHT